MADEEKVVLRKDGTVLFVIRSEEYVLRRPTLGEFKKLREVETAITESRKERGDDIDVVMTNLEQNGEWFREVLSALCDKQVEFAIDEGPLWLSSGNLARDLTEHWLSAPLAPSPGANPGRARS